MPRLSGRPITRVATPNRVRRPVVLPAWSLRLRLRDTPGAARYFFLGDPDFRRTRQPWHYVEQLGDAHRLQSDGQRLTVLTRKRGPFVTEARLIVDPDGRDA